jgi:hypothetical protein
MIKYSLTTPNLHELIISASGESFYLDQYPHPMAEFNRQAWPEMTTFVQKKQILNYLCGNHF